jgi:protein-S-isoprenylcysteine O-methyltransferase Ste14
MTLLLKSIFFTVLFPGTVTAVVPYLILSGRLAGASGRAGVWHWLGLAPIAIGAGILLRCVWDFAARGRGTLAPVDPPKELVVSGLYRYVRNPMYVGVLSVLLGEALFFRSNALLVYAAGFWTTTHLFVLLYEEPVLRRKFGESYQRYCRTVNRRLPWKPRVC